MREREKQRAKQKHPRLSSRQSALVKALNTKKANGQFHSIGEAAVIAGYSPLNPDQSGHQALKGIREKMPQILNRHGLTADALVTKYLAPALEAKETKFFQNGGVVMEQRDVVAWGPRLEALDMTFKLRGDYVPEQKTETQVLNKITIVVEDVSREGMHSVTAKAERVQ